MSSLQLICWKLRKIEVACLQVTLTGLAEAEGQPQDRDRDPLETALSYPHLACLIHKDDVDSSQKIFPCLFELARNLKGLYGCDTEKRIVVAVMTCPTKLRAT